MRIAAAAEEAIIIYLAEHPDDSVLDRVRQLSDAIVEELADCVTDLVPSFTSLMVYYDIAMIDYGSLHNRLLSVIDRVAERSAVAAPARTVEIPVYYGEEVADDLLRISELTGLDRKQIIDLHTQHEVRVYALGFRPGFGFMGTLPECLRVPRLETPRKQVPKGAVAIAEGQTAVYPDISPGGWNLIGRCPLPMFDRCGSEPKTFLQVGDRIRFNQISREQFLRSGGELSA